MDQRRLRASDVLFNGRLWDSDRTFEVGGLGNDATVDDGYRAGSLTSFQLLAVAKELARTEVVVKLLGMVNAEPVFVNQQC